MKFSLKLQDDHHQQVNPVVNAKIPLSILNQPFMSSISTASLATSLSFSLSSNFDSGPSLKLSYSPIATTRTSARSPPVSLTLKSGLGLFGSPKKSPLVFKAYFSFSSPNTTFSLHFKPRFGHFSLKKTVFSNPRHVLPSGSAPKPGNDTISGTGQGSGDLEVGDGSPVWQEVKLEPCGGGLGGNCESGLGPKRGESGRILEGIAVMARTVFPVGKRASVSVRWGVNFPAELGAKMPSLRMNKIVVEKDRDEERKNGKVESGNAGDLELLKGMCYWMRRDLEALERENREMKHRLEEISKLGPSKGRQFQPKSGPRVVPVPEDSGEFERWKKKKNEEEPVKREVKKPSSAGSDLESELQRAIAAAAGSSG